MPENVRRALELIISGSVQGVSFRLETRAQARSLGINGFAKNLPDGTVHIIAEGAEEALLKFLGWCKKGPPFAQVENIHVEWLKEIKYFHEFSII